MPHQGLLVFILRIIDWSSLQNLIIFWVKFKVHLLILRYYFMHSILQNGENVAREFICGESKDYLEPRSCIKIPQYSTHLIWDNLY